MEEQKRIEEKQYSEDTDTRIIYLDYLRVLATFAVIILHISATKWYDSQVHSLEWQAYNLYDSLVRWAVPVFVMISGTLFLQKEIGIKVILKKYILRLLIAYVVWSFIYAMAYPVANAVLKGKHMQVWTIMQKVFPAPYHMWYIPMIIGLYLIIPLLKQMISSEYMMRIFLKLSIIFAFVLPWCGMIVFDFNSLSES